MSAHPVDISEEDGIWVALDRVSGIFGCGDTAAEGVEDFHHAVLDHLGMLEAAERLAEPLRRQLQYLRNVVAEHDASHSASTRWAVGPLTQGLPHDQDPA